MKRCWGKVVQHAFLLAGLVLGTSPCFAQGPVERFYEPTEEEAAGDAKDSDEKENFGPKDGRARGTLMQWSYGTSFSGGPDLDEPLVTDRPDFTEASSTVGRGVLQMEMGYTYSYANFDGLQVIGHTYPDALFRLGVLAEWLELRVGQTYVSSYEKDVLHQRSIQGVDDLYLGMKIALTPQEGILPEMAIIPQMSVPSGDPDLTGNEVLPGLNWLYSWDLTERVSLGGSTQANKLPHSIGVDYYVAQSLSLGFSITEELGSYIEWFCILPNGGAGHLAEHYIDGGFTYLLSNDVQLDFRAGVGLTDASLDYFLGPGLSVRF